MNNIKYVIYTLIVLSSSSLFGQNKKMAFRIETDPITTVFGAKTITMILESSKIKNWSSSYTVVSADFPQWMDDFLNPNNKGKGFDAEISIGGGFSIDYFKKQNRTGVYFGLINLFFKNIINVNGTDGMVATHNIIPRVGYRWNPFTKSKIYFNPFLGVRYEYNLQNKLNLENLEFEPAGFQPFGTIHIGYAF